MYMSIVYYASHIASSREGPVDATARSLVKYIRYAIARLYWFSLTAEKA